TACDLTNAPNTFDGYPGGDAYVNAGGEWALLRETDGRHDVPFRTLIQPAVDLTYLTTFRASHGVARLNDTRVLLVGNDGTSVIVDPLSNRSEATGRASDARSNFTTELLNDGTVIINGGYNFSKT